MIEKKWGKPIVCNDGVTIAKEFDLEDAKRALEAPTRQIAENSSVDGGVVVDKMRTGSGNYGFDASHSQYCDLIEAGIIDPTKVVRIAL